MTEKRKNRTIHDEEALAQLEIARRERIPAALVTVIESGGSVPRKPGAKMLVTAEGQWGSIGGGEIERQAIERARELLVSGGCAEVFERHLTRDLGMCCGGSMKLFLEPMIPNPELIIFGAGHIGRALCAMAAMAGFDVVVCDGREEWLNGERFPDAKRLILEEPEGAVTSLGIRKDSFAVIVTHEHSIDEATVKRILRLTELPRYIGMIGSRRKRENFVERLTAAGIERSLIERVHTPVGLNIGALTPEEIAVSIVAELIAVRRGVVEARGW
ncbi:MAG: XdhC/CoxI family protein [Myxococcota bacterium]